MFSHFSQFDAAATSNILLRESRPHQQDNNMHNMPDVVGLGLVVGTRERSTLLTLVGMVVVLLLVSVIIVGTGLHSGFVWIILAGICIAWVFVCSCSNCKKVFNMRLRRISDRSDTISTISDFNESPYIGYAHPGPIDEAHVWAQDLPPSYDVVSDSLEQQPPSYASVIALLSPTNNRQRIGIPGSPALPLPPAYNDILPCTNITISTATNMHTSAGIHNSNGNSDIITVNTSRPSEELMQQNGLPSRGHTCISIISGCNLNESAQKITNIDTPVIASQELPVLPNDNQTITHPADTHIPVHTVNNCEPQCRDHSSC